VSEKPVSSNRLKDKHKTVNSKQKTTRANDAQPDMSCLSECVQEVLREFIADRKERKKPMTNRAIEAMARKLAGMSDKDSERIAIVEQSIAAGWLGLFEVKDAKSKDNSPTGANRFMKLWEEEREKGQIE
jgi:hypothetical protein